LLQLQPIEAHDLGGSDGAADHQPWTWQDQYGFVQGNESTGAQRTLFRAGQTSNDADGRPVFPGDMAAQINQCLDSLEAVLAEVGLTLANVVRLNSYTTNVDALLGAYSVLVDRLAANCRPASTLLGVARLAFPELMLEIEATAVA
jgi:enamine deaminase RidA (YjgF/YER057c/UK114 family)